MDLKEILKKLKEEKDPLKYLKELLKKVKERDLKKEIEKLIEKLEREAKKHPTLESSVQHIPLRVQNETEVFEPYLPGGRRERIQTLMPQREQEHKPGESYGSSIKTNYVSSDSDFRSSLETSGLVSRSGFNTTAEAKEAIRQKGSNLTGNYNLKEERIQYHSERDEFTKEDLTGLPHDLKESHKKRRNLGIYNG